MYQNTFETLAVETMLTARQKINNEKWQEIGSFFIQNYVEQLSKQEKAVIGHVKGLLELEADNFIKFSCVSQNRPVDSEMFNQEGSSSAGRLTFNAIVSGIENNINIQNFHLALERTCSVYELTTNYQETVHHDSETIEQHSEACPVCHEHHHDETCSHHH